MNKRAHVLIPFEYAPTCPNNIVHWHRNVVMWGNTLLTEGNTQFWVMNYNWRNFCIMCFEKTIVILPYHMYTIWVYISFYVVLANKRIKNRVCGIFLLPFSRDKRTDKSFIFFNILVIRYFIDSYVIDTRFDIYVFILYLKILYRFKSSANYEYIQITYYITSIYVSKC